MDFDSLIESFYSYMKERLEYTTLDSEQIQQWEKDTLHYFRIQIEPYVFGYLNHTYGYKLDEFWKTHQFPKKSKYAFVIVERRPHTNWWFVLRNIAWAAPHFSLYIFCSDLNYDFIKSILGDKFDNVHVTIWFKGPVDRLTGWTEYSTTFKMPEFYNLIDAEYFINVQMDSYFLQKIPDWIFTGIYYGIPWGWRKDYAGCGGLAVRNTKKMYELCKKEIKNTLNNVAEDVYFCEALIKHGLEYPDFEFRKRVFQENFPTEEIPIGIHQFWTYLLNYNITNKELFRNHIKKVVTIIGL
jgi:hypothetical protein